MNAAIVRLFFLVFVLYGVLVGFTSHWSVFAADEMREHSANKRPLLHEQQIRRGKILAADGTVIARSRPRGEGRQRIYVRRYPQGSLFGHPVGYSFLERGRIGVERSHNDALVGEKAEFVSILDQLRGRRQEGDNLKLNLDPRAQKAAFSALGGRRGSVVAIEPATGRVRTMVSVPSFHPGEVPDDFGRLAKAKGSPLLNRATQSSYTPGSAFKVVTAAAALDSGKFNPQSTVNGNSGLPISGVPLRNFGGRDWGSVTLTTALTNSVNTAWATVAESLGTKTMLKYMTRFGFNAVPPLDYPDEQMTVSGIYDGRRLLDGDDRIDIGRAAIGQERLRVTPLQMAMVAAAIGNGGVLMRPRLWDRVIDLDGRTVDRMKPRKVRRVISAKSARQLAQMMSNVVREGTGTAAALSGINVAGKTGTAEVGNANQAWFVAFAPVDKPRIAIAVSVERTTGQGGTVAAPIAKQVMQTLVGRGGGR